MIIYLKVTIVVIIFSINLLRDFLACCMIYVVAA